MSCQILFDTMQPFRSGDIIRGNLNCMFPSQTKIRGIKIRVHGDEHTEMMGTESYYDDVQKRHETRSVLLTGDNSIFSFELMLFGGTSGDSYVGPGHSTYQFVFQLPAGLPDVFQIDNNYIRYKMKGIVDIPWGKDYESSVYLDIRTPIDLNLFPAESFQPTSRSDSKTICCWCCAGGDITISININKTAFVPQEKIKFFVALTNMSNSNVDSLQCELTRTTWIKVHSPHSETETKKDELSTNTWPGVGAHGERNYDIELPVGDNLYVPNLSQSSLFENCYDVEVTATIPGFHSNISLSFSIQLGHIQHQSQMGGQQPYEQTGYPYSSANFQAAANAPPIGSAPYPNQPANAPGQYPYPTQELGFVMPEAGASAPFAPAGNFGDPPNYAAVSSDAPSPPGYLTPMNPKEREAYGGERAPLVPPSNLPPPSYEDITKAT